MKKIFYFIFILFIKFMAILPQSARHGFFLLLARFVYLIGGKTNKVITSNVNFVYPNKYSDTQIKEIQKYTYHNMLLWVQSMIENLSMTKEKMLSMVTVENEQHVKELIEEKKRVIFVTAHYGNIEVLGYYLNQFISPVVQVARESNFKEIDQFIIESRQKSGCEIVFKQGALRHLLKAMKKSIPVSLIIDQNTPEKDSDKVMFFGREVFQTSTASILARKMDAYIVPLACINQPGNKYVIKFYDVISPIHTTDESKDLQELSQFQASAIEKIISEDPKQWFWAHKRFKNSHREIYG